MFTPKLQAQLANNPSQYVTAGKELASKQGLSAQEFAALTPTQFEQARKTISAEQRR